MRSRGSDDAGAGEESEPATFAEIPNSLWTAPCTRCRCTSQRSRVPLQAYAAAGQ